MYRNIDPQDLKTILELHRKWVMRESDGARADLSSADLSSADLSSADLSSADLSSANLSSANLSSADLSSADLSSANLSSANLSSIVEDFYKVLDAAKTEVSELYKSIWDGKINGSVYEGDCACLVGTIAKIKHVKYTEIEGLTPDSDRLAERWFLGMKEGDMPQNSEVSKLTAEWLEKYMEKEGMQIPKRSAIWS